eukprot:CAMPEP_0114496728 /NCGR_PEP_ID=MMETSP0109-20121206/5927_1 /TAXON_ID=29199 /ORGANISM="Chlorarachnion reptans, Strain CCCM449" /LENGTH=139 /DNA_ID=CAMNT_0001674025 /DNA_START=72 /DNA_END=491 /DNA_ORIENTATION=-
MEEKSKEHGDGKNAKKKVTTAELLQRAFGRIPEHERSDEHPSNICYQLLQKAPPKMLDVVSITLKSCRNAGLPPGVKFPPGKSLMKASYEVYCEIHGDPEPIAEPDQKKAAMETWLEMSQMLEKTLKLMFEKAKTHLGI